MKKIAFLLKVLMKLWNTMLVKLKFQEVNLFCAFIGVYNEKLDGEWGWMHKRQNFYYPLSNIILWREVRSCDDTRYISRWACGTVAGVNPKELPNYLDHLHHAPSTIHRHNHALDLLLTFEIQYIWREYYLSLIK